MYAGYIRMYGEEESNGCGKNSRGERDENGERFIGNEGALGARVVGPSETPEQIQCRNRPMSNVQVHERAAVGGRGAKILVKKLMALRGT
jgi:hypothetical protein